MLQLLNSISVIVLFGLFTLAVPCETADTAVLEKPPAEIAPIKAPFPMPQLSRPVFPNQTFNMLTMARNPAEKRKTPRLSPKR